MSAYNEEAAGSAYEHLLSAVSYGRFRAPLVSEGIIHMTAYHPDYDGAVY